MLNAINKISGKALPLRGDDIDTDRIIPARFLLCVTFDGLGENAFIDERFSPDGKPTKHPMNDKNYSNATIIISNNNFGCGSSREHAPQAIKRAGFTAIIAESFAEIFIGNSNVLGLACITLPKKDIEEILTAVEKNPGTEVEISLEKLTVDVGDKSYNVFMKDSARNAFINGRYDTIMELHANMETVREFNKNLPY